MKIAIFVLFLALPFPTRRLYIHPMSPDLPDLSGLQTVGGECSTEATPCIDTDSVRSDPESLFCPVSVDHRLGSCIAIIPWSLIDESD